MYKTCDFGGYAFSDSELMISRAASLDRGLIEHGNGSGALGTGQDERGASETKTVPEHGVLEGDNRLERPPGGGVCLLGDVEGGEHGREDDPEGGIDEV